MRDFRRDGLHVDDPELLKMKEELSDLENDFKKNLNDDNTSFELTREQLSGMPESWFTEKRKVRDNIYKVTLKYPDYVPASNYVKNEEVRKTLYLAR